LLVRRDVVLCYLRLRAVREAPRQLVPVMRRALTAIDAAILTGSIIVGIHHVFNLFVNMSKL